MRTRTKEVSQLTVTNEVEMSDFFLFVGPLHVDVVPHDDDVTLALLVNQPARMRKIAMKKRAGKLVASI